MCLGLPFWVLWYFENLYSQKIQASKSQRQWPSQYKHPVRIKTLFGTNIYVNICFSIDLIHIHAQTQNNGIIHGCKPRDIHPYPDRNAQAVLHVNLSFFGKRFARTLEWHRGLPTALFGPLISNNFEYLSLSNSYLQWSENSNKDCWKPLKNYIWSQTKGQQIFCSQNTLLILRLNISFYLKLLQRRWCLLYLIENSSVFWDPRPKMYERMFVAPSSIKVICFLPSFSSQEAMLIHFWITIIFTKCKMGPWLQLGPGPKK